MSAGTPVILTVDFRGFTQTCPFGTKILHYFQYFNLITSYHSAFCYIHYWELR